MIGGEVLLPHSETVAALLVHVQFGGFVSAGPLFVQSDAIGCETEIVIGGGGDKQGRGIGWNGRILKRAPGRIGRSGEGRAALRRRNERQLRQRRFHRQRIR